MLNLPDDDYLLESIIESWSETIEDEELNQMVFDLLQKSNIEEKIKVAIENGMTLQNFDKEYDFLYEFYTGLYDLSDEAQWTLSNRLDEARERFRDYL